jgi:mannan endo-1,4-beta-mannosidase
MINTIVLSKILLIIALTFMPLILLSQLSHESGEFTNFITQSGAKLYDGEKEFRFISFNIPNLLIIEDNLDFTECNPWRLPDRFEIEDAFRTIRALGGTVVRTYVLPVRRPDDTENVPRYVLGPGQFNEEAFRAMDQVLALANEFGVRLIIPFADNWKWMGGRMHYAAFRDKQPDDFWTDPQLKKDYQEMVQFVLNRRNTLTGTIYKDEKAILAWELGNEIWQAPPEWITEMSAYVKSLDSNHLLNDGLQFFSIRNDILANPNIDLLSTHHYEKNPQVMIQHIQEIVRKIDGKKPFYIGEFGFIDEPSIQAMLDTVIQNRDISGGLLWSLRFHNRDGGFYWHSEPSGRGVYKAYHYPGFTSGERYDEKKVLKLLNQKCFEIRGMAKPEPLPPLPPILLPINDAAHITWQGSVGAEGYFVERSDNLEGPWQVVGDSISDAICAYEALFNDQSVEIGKEYYYRVSAFNAAGKSEASNVVGPVMVKHHVMIDHLIDLKLLHSLKGKGTLENGNDRAFKEDLHRLAVSKGTEVVYLVHGIIWKGIINNFTQKLGWFMEIEASRDGKKFQQVAFKQEEYSIENADYPYWRAFQTIIEQIPDDMHYIKLKYTNPAQIGKVEIYYAD